MGKKSNSFFSWVITIVGIIGTIFGGMNWEFVKELLNIIWSAVIAFFTFKIPVWTVLSGIVLIILILYFINLFSAPYIPEFVKNYNTASIKGFKWTWRWVYDGNGWDIDNLKPHCPMCATTLKTDVVPKGLSLSCPREDFKKLLPFDFKEDVRIIIKDEVDRRG